MVVKIKKMSDTAIIPEKATEGSAGYDIYVDSDKPIEIPPHETIMIPSGIAMEIPDGYFGAIYPRSGISTKRGLRIANCVGVIDSDYRGPIGLPIHNDGRFTQTIEPYERVAQIIFQKYDDVSIVEVNELSKTERGYNGFGSTGTL